MTVTVPDHVRRSTPNWRVRCVDGVATTTVASQVDEWGISVTSHEAWNPPVALVTHGPRPAKFVSASAHCVL
jgi:hypothetical protein